MSSMVLRIKEIVVKQGIHFPAFHVPTTETEFKQKIHE